MVLTARAGSRARRALPAALAFAVLLSGCGDSTASTDVGSPTSAGATPTPATSTDTATPATATASQPPSPIPTPTTTPLADASRPASDAAAAAAASDCPADASNLEPTLPPDATRAEEATGDLDGDGQPDRLITYRAGGQAGFFLRVVLATGYVVDAPLDQASDITHVKPLGAVDLTGSPATAPHRQVAFVVEQAGASTDNLSLWAMPDDPLEPCGLARVTLPDTSTPTLFPVGGSSGAGSGLACRDVNGDGTTDLVVRSVSSSGDNRYDWSEHAWHWPGADALAPVAQDSGTFQTPGDRDKIDVFYTLDCDGVASP